MRIFCFGLNHKTAPVEIREKLAIAESALPTALGEICELEGIREAVILSTCNRMEVYAVGDLGGQGASRLGTYLREHFGLGEDEASAFYVHEDAAAAFHLFRVASGLDSMVLGETEVFGQVKKAYHSAHALEATSRALNKLFQQAFHVGKKVRSTTSITRGSTSVGAVAVDLAEKIFGDLGRCNVLIIGAGEMSRRTGKSLLSRGAKSIIVSNRSYDRAAVLAQEMKGSAIPFERWLEAVPQVDIVISSTSAPGAFIEAPSIREAMDRRGGRPLFMIDIAVPRDIHPEVNHIESVYLYDIDALEAIADRGRRKRERQIAQCERLIAGELAAWDRPEGIHGEGWKGSET
ncbi:MAG: glutamyl-tRNA reductase [Verrucomicrobiales bacterium]